MPLFSSAWATQANKMKNIKNLNNLIIKNLITINKHDIIYLDIIF